MLTHDHIEPIDYLVIGHLTKDLTPQGSRMGGTASFASLTGKALGMRVGIITSCGNDIDRTSLSIPNMGEYNICITELPPWIIRWYRKYGKTPPSSTLDRSTKRLTLIYPNYFLIPWLF
jgi:hypothetical protein